MRFEEMRMKMQKNEKEKETGLTNRILTYFSYLNGFSIFHCNSIDGLTFIPEVMPGLT